MQFVKSRADIECEQSQPNNKILSSKLSTSDHFDPPASSF